MNRDRALHCTVLNCVQSVRYAYALRLRVSVARYDTRAPRSRRVQAFVHLSADEPSSRGHPPSIRAC